MADSSITPSFSRFDLPERLTQSDIEANRFTEAALERHKREGMELAVRARWLALAVVAVMLPLLNPSWDVLYYHLMLALMAGTGLLAQRVARVGVSRLELAVLFCDLALLTIVLVAPNPFSQNDWPSAAPYQFELFQYFLIILAAGTMAYSWRTIAAMGLWAAGMWLTAAGMVWWFGKTDLALSEAVNTALAGFPEFAQLADPNRVNFDLRLQETVVFLIVALTLALSVRRFNRLLLSNAALERERENLSRYFSPNVVDELSQHDEPLKQIRSHDIAVLFVDIADFTAFAAERDPNEVIETLREFHARMEQEVFRFNGTLDKYLGDGLMATFGTPEPGEKDASNALRCARAMQVSVQDWNRDRARWGQPTIDARFGLHYGPVVLADIGTSRLEYAVIGNTVNVASRIERLTRTLPGPVAFSDDLKTRVVEEVGANDLVLEEIGEFRDQTIRGLDKSITVWSAG